MAYYPLGLVDCPACRRQTPIIHDTPNHVLHFIVSALTGGTWLLVWLIVVMLPTKRCSECGYLVSGGSQTLFSFISCLGGVLIFIVLALSVLNKYVIDLF